MYFHKAVRIMAFLCNNKGNVLCLTFGCSFCYRLLGFKSDFRVVMISDESNLGIPTRAWNGQVYFCTVWAYIGRVHFETFERMPFWYISIEIGHLLAFDVNPWNDMITNLNPTLYETHSRWIWASDIFWQYCLCAWNTCWIQTVLELGAQSVTLWRIKLGPSKI